LVRRRVRRHSDESRIHSAIRSESQLTEPTFELAVETTYYLASYNLTDLAGNPQQNFCVGFNTGTGTDKTAPVVKQVSPPSAFSGVPINAPVQVLFTEPISAASLEGVTLTQNGSVVPSATSLFDGDQGVQLLPLLPLSPNAVYTINATGVVDINGNAQSSFTPTSFTTGSGTDLLTPRGDLDDTG
jgi:large repetitive protein